MPLQYSKMHLRTLTNYKILRVLPWTQAGGATPPAPTVNTELIVRPLKIISSAAPCDDFMLSNYDIYFFALTASEP
jgi:hypothetical protein